MNRTAGMLLVALGAAQAVVIRVPSEQPTIQAGLNAALAGDTVLVAPDTFYENIVWPARDGITLLSEEGPERTVIDGSGLGRVITMNALVYSGATVVSGFTITSGLVSTYPGNGAGLWCRGAPEIARCHIVRNKLTTMGYGGGVFADGAPTMHHNLIAWDSIINEGGGGWRYGAGVFCSGSGIFYHNVFRENAGLGGAGGFWSGGGLHLAAGTPQVFANLFLGNRMGTTTGGIAYGAGLYVDSATAYVVNNTFVANVCSTAIAYGGAVFVYRNWRSVVKNNIFAQNACAGIAPAAGAVASYPDTLGDTLPIDWNDAWQNQPNNYYGVRVGPNSLFLDPLFATGTRGDYYLSQVASGQPDESPCVDAGDTVTPTIEALLRSWTTRTDSMPDSLALDLGYHYERQPLTSVSEPEGRPVPAGPVLTPNPVAGTRVRVGGSLPVRLLDVTGRMRAKLRPGWNDVSRLPNGVYMVEDRDRTKLVVVRKGEE